MSTKLMIAMEDSVLMIESSRTGWKKIHECLKGTYPQCIISLVQYGKREKKQSNEQGAFVTTLYFPR
jgi:hypothetical protein